MKFETPSQHAIARLELRGFDPKDQERVRVACGRVTGDHIYQVPFTQHLEPGSTLGIALFDEPANDSEQKRASIVRNTRQSAILTKEMIQLEVAARTNWGNLLTMMSPASVQDMASLMGSIEDTETSLDELVASCTEGPKPSTYQRALCDEAERIQKDVFTPQIFPMARRPFREGLKVIADLEIEKAELEELRKEKAPAESVRAQEQRVAALDKRLAELRKGLDPEKYRAESLQVIQRLKQLPAAPKGDALQAVCKKFATLQWYEEATTRLITAAEIPVVDPASLTIASYGAGEGSPKEIQAEKPWGVLMGGIPTGTEVSVATKTGSVMRKQLVDVIHDFAVLVIPGVKGLRAFDSQSAFCGEHMGSPDTKQWMADAASLPLAQTQTRGFVLRKIDPTLKTSFILCQGADCAKRTSDEVVRNKIDLTVEQDLSYTMMVEMAASASLDHCRWGDGSLQLGCMGRPVFEPVGGLTGPDQLYQLRYQYDAREALSTSVLLAVRFKKVWMAGIGPSLLLGTGGGAFNQWNLRLGRQLTHGLYITLGPGFRLVSRAVDFEEGARVSVPRDAAQPTPQNPRVYTKAVATMSLGLTIDLGAVADQTGKLLGAIGVGGK